MPAGKSRDYPMPGTHFKCRSCPISMVCLSGRRDSRQAHWCNHCRGAYYKNIDVTVKCVVFRSKRGRYPQQLPCCPACSTQDPMVLHDSITFTRGPNTGHKQIIEGITHDDAKAWRERRPDGRMEAQAGPHTS